MAEPNKTSVKKQTSSPGSNLAMNIVIFLLGAIILYMVYSIVIKMTADKSDPKIAENASGKLASVSIQAEVQNGCGVPGTGDRFADYLRANKIDVVSVGNYSSSDVEKTMVIDRSGNTANAKKVAALLGVKDENIIEQVNSDYLLEVSVIIGRDFSKLSPLK